MVLSGPGWELTAYPLMCPTDFEDIFAFYMLWTWWCFSISFGCSFWPPRILEVLCCVRVLTFLGGSILGSWNWVRLVLEKLDCANCLIETPEPILLWLKLVKIYLDWDFELWCSIVAIWQSNSTFARLIIGLANELLFRKTGKLLGLWASCDYGFFCPFSILYLIAQTHLSHVSQFYIPNQKCFSTSSTVERNIV